MKARVVFYLPVVLGVPLAAMGAEPLATNTTTTTITVSSDSSAPPIKLVEGVCILPQISCKSSSKRQAPPQKEFNYCLRYHDQYDKEKRSEARDFDEECAKVVKASENAIKEQASNASAVYSVSLTYRLRTDVAFLLKDGSLIKAKELDIKGPIIITKDITSEENDNIKSMKKHNWCETETEHLFNEYTKCPPI